MFANRRSSVRLPGARCIRGAFWVLLFGASPAAAVRCGPAVALTLSLPAGHRSTEANIAVDPADPRDVLVLARDEDRGRLVGLRTWRSHDGGFTFKGEMLVDRRLAGRRANASDPVALFDQLGRPAPAFLALRYGRSTWETRIMLDHRTVVRTVYGRPFPTLGEGFGTRRWYDKPWAAIDPHSGLAYVTWTNRSATKTGPEEKVAVTSAAAGKPFPKAHVLGNGSGSQPVIGPGSTVVLVWYYTPNLSTHAQVLSSRSLNHGRTWSKPVVIANGVNARGDAPFPTVARTGSDYVACWQQYVTWPRERIACSRSKNGGSWSRPRIVAQPSGAGNAAQPALATSPDGRLWLAFYRFDRGSTSVELWSSTAATNTWRRQAVLLHRPVPRSGSDFLGDYEGLAATHDMVIAAFVMPTHARAFRQVVEVARFPIRGGPRRPSGTVGWKSRRVRDLGSPRCVQSAMSLVFGFWDVCWCRGRAWGLPDAHWAGPSASVACRCQRRRWRVRSPRRP